MRFSFIILLSMLSIVGCKKDADAQGVSASRALSVVSVDGKRHDFVIELALTPQQQAQGLMNRTRMDDKAGMLFVFEGEAERAFWMKNTLIPLDIIYIKKNGIIHHIHRNAVPNDLTSIPSNGPVSAVLEINGGLSDKLGIKLGDKIHHLIFQNAF